MLKVGMSRTFFRY